MLRAKDLKTLSYLVSIFTPQLNFSVNSILTEMMTKFGKVLDGQLMTVPLPPEAPAEIPRLTLSSNDQGVRLEISPVRTNLMRFGRKNDAEIDSQEFLSLASQIFGTYLGVSAAVVGRLASVIVKYEILQRPGIEVARHFCRDERLNTVLNRPENFEIHAHKVYEPKGLFKINSWVRTRAGILGPQNQPAAVVEQDLNTLHEELEQRRFGAGDIKNFLEVANREHQDILEKYFPNHG
jgi:hypothetical protein